MRGARGGTAVKILGWSVVGLVVLAGVGMLVLWWRHWVREHRAWVTDVRTPATGDALVDVHPGWSVSKSPLGDGCFRATIALTAVPAGTLLEDDPLPEGLMSVGSRALRVPQGLPHAVPVAGAEVEVVLSLPNAGPLVGKGSPALADGTTKAILTTGADGTAAVDVRKGDGGGFAHLIAYFSFRKSDGTTPAHRWPTNLMHPIR